jgi:sugar/nucleoside kinase (ribokinase family)
MISTNIEVLGIGAPLMDHFLPVSEEFLSQISGRKGGMEQVSDGKFREIMDKIHSQSTPIPAGCTVNIVKGLAHLGHSCKFLGKAGQDVTADAFSKYLESIGVKTDIIPSKTPTAQALCLVTPDGERTIRTFIGAAGKIKAKHVSDELFENVRHAHIEGYCIYRGDLIDRVVELAHKNKVSVSMDLGSFETVEHFKDHFFEIIKKKVDILFANDKEAKALTQQSPKEACQTLGKFCETVVITEGPRGCWVTSKDLEDPIHCDAQPVEKVVDTTGAGDAFACGFIHGFLNRLSTMECAQRGGLAASMMIQIQGTNLSKSAWVQLK